MPDRSRIAILLALLVACSADATRPPQPTVTADAEVNAAPPDLVVWSLPPFGADPAQTIPIAPAPAPAPDPCKDEDGDGFGPGCLSGEDCAPLEPRANAGAQEKCFDGLDNDCDGRTDEACGCDPTDPTCTLAETPQSMGQLVFELSSAFMSLDPVCGPEREAALATRHDALVSSVDAIVQGGDALGTAARTQLGPLLASGDLQTTALAMTNALGLLVDDGFDPERRTLHGLAALLTAPTALRGDDVLRLAERVLGDAGTSELLQSIAALGGTPIGTTNVAQAFLEVAHGALGAQSETLACDGLELGGLARRLLDPAGMPPRTELGAPAWTADPFHPGRSLDVKRTPLAFTLELTSRALDAGVPRDLSLVLDAALGTAAPCGPGCLRYPEHDNPVADLLAPLTDWLRHEELNALMRGLSTLLRERPEAAGRLIAAAGQWLDSARSAQLGLDPRELLRLARELLPLLEPWLDRDGETPRLLMRAIHQLGQTSRDFPEQLRWTLDYAALAKAQTCSAEPPDFSRSRKVDYRAPRSPDNRSALEQVIALLDRVDCGRVPFSGGKSVAEVVLHMAARMSPGRVCRLTDGALSAMHRTGRLGRFATRVALRTVGCRDARAVVSELDAIEHLAASGALDFLVPLVRVFAEEGQIPTLLGIFSHIADDLARDDDADPGTRSAVRPLLPLVSALIEEGTVDALFDVVDGLATERTTDAQGKPALLSDVLIDAVARFVAEGEIRVRGATRTSSYARESLAALERIFQRLDRGPPREALARIAAYTADILRARPDGQLAEASLLPVFLRLTEGLEDVLRLSPPQRACYVRGLGADLDALFRSRELATWILTLRVLRASPELPSIERVLAGWLVPASKSPVYGSLLTVGAQLLATPLPERALDAMWPYFERVLDPEATDGPAILNTVDALLGRDPEGVFVEMLRRAVTQGPDGTAEAPLATLVSAYQVPLSLAPDRCTADEAWSAEGLDSALRTLVGFLRDERYGLRALFGALAQLEAEAP